MTEKECSVCGVKFRCGPMGNQVNCWCEKLPSIMPAEYEQGCRCPACLAQVVAKKIDYAGNDCTHEEMLKYAANYRSEKTLIEFIDYTIENGNYVFSQWYHLKRGKCCGNGCRHCPYGNKS